MIKKITAALCAVLTMLLLSVTVFASEGTYVYFSDGFYFTASQVKELDSAAKSIKYKYNFPVFYYLVDDIGSSENVFDFAKAEYNAKAPKTAGVMFVSYITDGSEKVYLYAANGANELFGEDVQQNMHDIYDDAPNYFSAAKSYYAYASEVLEKNSDRAIRIAEAAQLADESDDEEKSTCLVDDRTGTLSSIQRDKLSEKLAGYSADTSCRFTVVITNSLDGMSAEKYAESYYAEKNCGFYGESGNGVLLLLNIGHNEGENDWIVYASDGVKDYYPAKTVNKIMKPVVKKLVEKDYVGALNTYADGVYDRCGKQPAPSLIWLPASFAIGFVVAFIILKIMTRGLKSVASAKSAGNYIEKNSVEISSESDILTGTEISKTRRADSNNKSSGKGNTSGGKF